MKTVHDMLAAADPLPDDFRRLGEERGRLRHVVLGAVATGSAPTSRLRPSRRAALVTGTAIMIGLAAAGSHFWSAGGANLHAAVRFEVRLAEEQPAPGLIRAPIVGTDRVIYLHADSVVTNSDVAQSQVVPGDGPARFSIRVEFSPAGGMKMRGATANHVGRLLAILLDGDVVLAPVLRSPISESAVITGDYTQAEAERIANGIGVR